MNDAAHVNQVFLLEADASVVDVSDSKLIAVAEVWIMLWSHIQNLDQGLSVIESARIVVFSQVEKVSLTFV